MRVLVITFILALFPVVTLAQGEIPEYMRKDLEKHGIDPTKRITDDDLRRLISGESAPSSQSPKTVKTKPRYTRSDYRHVVDFFLENQIDPASLTQEKLKEAFLQ